MLLFRLPAGFRNWNGIYNKRCVGIDLFAERIENNGSSKEKLGKLNLSY